MTQSVLADRVCLTRGSITNIESGRQHFMIHTLAAIAQVLNVSVMSLLPEQSSANPSELELDMMLEGFATDEIEWMKTTINAVQ